MPDKQHGPAGDPEEGVDPGNGSDGSDSELPVRHPAVLWFGKRDGGLGFAPLAWQGRAAFFLCGFLVVVALIIYPQLAVTAFVILFYTVVFVLVLVVKSDLLKEWPPRS